MQVVSLLERKRDGGSLTASEWTQLIDAYGRGDVPDYQMSALLMAVVHRGLTTEELAAVTDAMLSSGRRLAFGGDVPTRIDKHSTGGIGDKVSLVLAPLVAACGVAVPMMSGRGLGHTGGTLDKLESIPGFRTQLSIAEVQRQVAEIGAAMFGQTDEIAPVDRRLYALRDVTGTVPSVPLIAASIMSKKLAEDLTGLVLDVKLGSGAFIADIEAARALAQTMIEIGEANGCPTTALLTAMDRPLGRAIGNALETEEAIMALRGEGPDDLVALTLALGAEMLVLAGVDPQLEDATDRLRSTLSSGAAAEKLREIVEAQGGNPAAVDDPAVLPQADVVEIVEAPRSGFVHRVEPKGLGRAVVAMGGGRREVTDEIDPAVGIVVTMGLGDRITAGEPVASVYARDAAGAAIGRDAVLAALEIGESAPETGFPLVVERVTRGGATGGA